MEVRENARRYAEQGICPYCGESCETGAGKCHCGCGEVAPLAEKTSLHSRRPGDEPRIEGMPNKYLQGHGIHKDQFLKLTAEKVREIRYLYATDETQTHRGLAEAYGVSESSIAHIVTFKTWKNVGIATSAEMKEKLVAST